MNVQLPGFVLADLYKNTLVITADAGKRHDAMPPQVTQNRPEKTPETVPAVEKKWFLGENRRGIVIAVKDENAVYMNDEWLETLTKLLDALKINLADTAIVNIYNHPAGFARLQAELGARHIFLFGVTTADIQLPFAIPDYQVQNYAGCVILRAPVVTLVSPAKATDGIKAEKRKLWESLKRISL